MDQGKILITEDEESLRSLISEKMKAAGYQVLEAANGEEAVAIATVSAARSISC